MKLKKVIKYLNQESCCRIYIDHVKNNTWDIIFEGFVMEIPWWLLELPLHNTADGEAIECVYDKNPDKPYFNAYFSISLIDPEEDKDDAE